MSCIRGHYIVKGLKLKEFNRTTTVEVDVINPNTGEVFTTKGANTETSKYYSIKHITSRINAMTLFNIMEKVCKSSKDISLTNKLIEMVSKENEIRIDNITELSKNFSVVRSKLNALLKAYETNNFLYKLDRGVYLVNPFIFVGRRVRSNKLREAAQMKWDSLNKETLTTDH